MSDIREKIHLKIAKDRDCHDEGCPDCLALTNSILSIVREAVSAAKPKEWTSVNGLNIQEVNGHNQALSDYHDALMEVLK